jgi:hypothetical protein
MALKMARPHLRNFLQRFAPFGSTCLVALWFLFLGLGACTPVQEVSPQPTLYRLPWPSDDGTAYAMRDVEVKSLSRPEDLKGELAEILIDPRLEIADAATGRQRLVSAQAQPNLLRTGSIIRPGDYLSLQAITLYAHWERLHELERVHGLNRSLSYPAQIGLMARVRESETSRELMIDNAVYDGRLDALLVVPFRGEGLPLAFNAGVIAHEHFHRVFQALLLRPLVSETSGRQSLHRHEFGACHWGVIAAAEDTSQGRASARPRASALGSAVSTQAVNETLLRAINEGFADFWGWSYSLDTQFIARSLSQREQEARKLDAPLTALPAAGDLRAALAIRGDDMDRVLYSYRLGTLYARGLKRLHDALLASGVESARARQMVQAAMLESLTPLLRAGAQDLEKKDLDPRSPMRWVAESLLNRLQRETGAASEKPRPSICEVARGLGIQQDVEGCREEIRP